MYTTMYTLQCTPLYNEQAVHCTLFSLFSATCINPMFTVHRILYSVHLIYSVHGTYILYFCLKCTAYSVHIVSREKSLTSLTAEEIKARFYHQCDLCAKSYANATGLKMHKKQVHDGKSGNVTENVSCSVCNKLFR